MARDDEKKLTPMMEQWFAAKNAQPDAILLFRMGDFYELFDNDAIIAAPILDLALTCRDKDKGGMKMAGFPFHAADSYVEKLVEHGFKVAVCEQLEDPKSTKGIVKRGITNVITPGTALIGEGLEYQQSVYLLALTRLEERFALAALDMQSSHFVVSETEHAEELWNEVTRFLPREIVVQADDDVIVKLAERYTAKMKHDAPVRIERRKVTTTLPHALHNVSLSGAERAASAMVLNYVQELKGAIFAHIGLPKRYAMREQLLMDDASRTNLDLIPKKKGDRHNLYALLNNMKTALGRRALLQWLMAPLTSLPEITARHDAVFEFTQSSSLRTQIRAALARCADLEKLAALSCAHKVSPRGLAQIRNSLAVADELQSFAKSNECAQFKKVVAAFPDYAACKHGLDITLVDEPPLYLKDGGIFKTGFDDELDAITDLVRNGKELILALEARERESTRIPSLKIKYTRVFGYYIEITKTHLDKVPAHYQRKQTIANGERFVTAELMALETRLNSAEEDAQRLIEMRFIELRQMIIDNADRLLALARSIATLDVLCGFAQKSVERSWVRPTMLEANARRSEIEEGRHPLIEELALIDGTYFVPNDIALNANENAVALITGPNMAGKSTIMRQIALAQIMAQMGCNVAAKSATLSLCDAIFARVGASDDPAQGRSTFMVEMAEAAAILSNATKHSLIILDEIGRGTSTYDGMSIAQAVCEYIHDHIEARTLFATHYHELTKLEEKLPRLKNFHVGVLEKTDSIHFLYSLRRGACLKSFGIEVARLSGLPKSVLDRARVILANLEAHQPEDAQSIEPAKIIAIESKPSLSACDDDLSETLLAVDINRTTPLQALNKIASWQQSVRKKRCADEHHQGMFALR